MSSTTAQFLDIPSSSSFVFVAYRRLTSLARRLHEAAAALSLMVMMRGSGCSSEASVV